MGDRPNGAVATVALYKTAGMEQENYPVEANIIKESSNVDDIVHSTESRELARTMIKTSH